MLVEILNPPVVEIPGKPLGRNILHDPRSLEHQVPRCVAPLRSVTHERHVPVFQQGRLGSCTGNASVGALACDPLFDALPAGHPELDEDYAVDVYSAATVIDPFTGTYPPEDTGSNGLSVAKILTSRGLISGYKWATSLSAMQAALQETPVIVGTYWYSSFDNTDADGVITLTPDAYVRGGHEFLVTEIDMDRGRFGAWNSWGPGYGLGGRFYVPFTVMDRLLGESGDCTQLLPAGKGMSE